MDIINLPDQNTRFFSWLLSHNGLFCSRECQFLNKEISLEMRQNMVTNALFLLSYKIIHSHIKCQIPYILIYSHTKGQVFVNFVYYLILSGSVTLFGPSE